MPRRVELPGASELFRPTDTESTNRSASAKVAATPPADAGVQASGRTRHDEKITVYVSADELIAVEQARLTLRAAHGVSVDRGRIIREALSLALADLASAGEDAPLVRRLTQS